MQRNVDGATEFARLNPVQVDLTAAGSDQNVVFAWMQVASCDLALRNKVLHELRLGHAGVLDVHELSPDAIGRGHGEHLE